MTVTSRTGFAVACREAVTAVLDALAAVGDQRRGHFFEAKLAADRTLHNANTGEEWYLAEHLSRGIRDVQVRAQDAA